MYNAFRNEARLKESLFKKPLFFSSTLFLLFLGGWIPRTPVHGIFFLIYLACTALLLLLSNAVVIFVAFFCGLQRPIFNKKMATNLQINVTVEFRAPKLGKSALFWSKKENFGAQVSMIWEKTEIWEGDLVHVHLRSVHYVATIRWEEAVWSGH